MITHTFTRVLVSSGLLVSITGCFATGNHHVVRQDPSTSAQMALSNDSEPGEQPTASFGKDTILQESLATVETVAYRDEDDTTSLQQSSDTNEALITDSNIHVESFSDPNEFGWAGDGLTLEALEHLALQNNPSIQQASAVASKAAGIRTQVGLKPNPTFGYSGAQLADAGTDQNSLFIEQTFVRGDKLAWNQQVIGHDVNSVMWQVEAQRQRVRTDIRVQFCEALAAQSRLRLARDFRDIAAKGVSISEERMTAKVGARPDVLQSEIQLSEVNLAIQQAEFEFEAAWNELAAVIGLPDLAPTILVGELDVVVGERDPDTAYAQIISESPLLASAIARVDRARANLQRQNVQAIPNITAQLGVGHDNGTGDEFVNVQLSLPIPVHNKNQGNIRAAHAEYCEATQNVQRLRMQIRRDLARVMRQYRIAQATVRQYDIEILPKAEETLELMQTAQEAGEFDFLRVLTARRAYFEVNLKYVTALGSLAQANAKIDGLLLTGGLSNFATYDVGDDLRGQALSGQ